MAELPDLAPLLERVRAIAGEAAAAILKVYATDFEVEAKADRSPLTLADRAAHDCIVEALCALTPAWPVLSEESDPQVHQARHAWRRFWLVDPLDGTREFVKRNGEFTVNIALIDDGRPVLGVVQVPVTGRCYAAAQGQGAWRHEADGDAGRLRVSDWRGGRALRVVCSRSHRSPDLEALLGQLPQIEEIAVGSSLKMCLVAEGSADFYPRLGPTSEWDTAAAHCVVEQAGGALTGLDLEPLRYNKPSILNPSFVAFGRGERPWAAHLRAG